MLFKAHSEKKEPTLLNKEKWNACGLRLVFKA